MANFFITGYKIVWNLVTYMLMTPGNIFLIPENLGWYFRTSHIEEKKSLVPYRWCMQEVERFNRGLFTCIISFRFHVRIRFVNTAQATAELAHRHSLASCMYWLNVFMTFCNLHARTCFRTYFHLVSSWHVLHACCSTIYPASDMQRSSTNHSTCRPGFKLSPNGGEESYVFSFIRSTYFHFLRGVFTILLWSTCKYSKLTLYIFSL